MLTGTVYNCAGLGVWHLLHRCFEFAILPDLVSLIYSESLCIAKGVLFKLIHVRSRTSFWTETVHNVQYRITCTAMHSTNTTSNLVPRNPQNCEFLDSEYKGLQSPSLEIHIIKFSIPILVAAISIQIFKSLIYHGFKSLICWKPTLKFAFKSLDDQIPNLLQTHVTISLQIPRQRSMEKFGIPNTPPQFLHHKLLRKFIIHRQMIIQVRAHPGLHSKAGHSPRSPFKPGLLCKAQLYSDRRVPSDGHTEPDTSSISIPSWVGYVVKNLITSSKLPMHLTGPHTLKMVNKRRDRMV
jgi:hypothetical protein